THARELSLREERNALDQAEMRDQAKAAEAACQRHEDDLREHYEGLLAGLQVELARQAEAQQKALFELDAAHRADKERTAAALQLSRTQALAAHDKENAAAL